MLTWRDRIGLGILEERIEVNIQGLMINGGLS